MADINFANLIYAIGALLLVTLGYFQFRRAREGLSAGRILAYLAIWAGILFAVALLYQTFS